MTDRDPRTPRAIATTYTDADRIAAYGVWKETGSLAKAAQATGVPHKTLQAWCAREKWVARREVEDELEREMALQRAFVRIVDKVDPMVSRLLHLALHGEGAKEEEVIRKHLLAALSLVGVTPVQRRIVTEDAKPQTRIVGDLSDADRRVIAELLGDDE